MLPVAVIGWRLNLLAMSKKEGQMRMKTYGDFFNVFTKDDLKYLQK